MKSFEIYIERVLVYGYIDNGFYSVCINDYGADDFSIEKGKESCAEAAWKIIYSKARKMNNENRKACDNFNDDDFNDLFTFENFTL